jgi:uncharacterized membrane protein
VDPVTSTVTIDQPHDVVFRYLEDVANHAEFTDHYLKDFRLTREDSIGVGAGARFRVDAPLNRFSWADVTVSEATPRAIVLRGRTGKYNRIRYVTRYELEPQGASGTVVSLTTETEPPKLPSDKLMEAIARGWFKRKQAKAARRLRSILEEGEDRGPRASVAAGGPRKPASQFRL